jgi:hypothetical protein
MYKLDSNGTGNTEVENLDCLSHILVEAYTKDLKEKLDPNKTFVEALNAHGYNEQKKRRMN